MKEKSKIYVHCKGLKLLRDVVKKAKLFREAYIKHRDNIDFKIDGYPLRCALEETGSELDEAFTKWEKFVTWEREEL